MARVRLFANLREMAGTGRLEIDAATVADALAELERRFGTEFAAGVAHSRIWVNGDEADPATPLHEADELAVIPPVSGGAHTQTALSGLEPLIVAIGVVALLAANLLLDTVSLMVALAVGLVALWVVDISRESALRGLAMEPWPVLSATLIGALATTGMGGAGAGIALAFAVVGALGWAVFRPEARELTAIGATVLASVIAAGATASLTMARLSTSGDDKVAAFIVMSVASIGVTWLFGTMRRPLLDPFTAGAVAAVLTAVAVAALTSLSLIAWFLTGIVVAIALISGRGLGAAYRTGEVYLAETMSGAFSILDGPVLAAAVFFPFVRLVG